MLLFTRRRRRALRIFEAESGGKSRVGDSHSLPRCLSVPGRASDCDARAHGHEGARHESTPIDAWVFLQLSDGQLFSEASALLGFAHDACFAFLSKPQRLGEAGALSGVIGRYHRIVVGKAPLRAVLIRRHVKVGT